MCTRAEVATHAVETLNTHTERDVCIRTEVVMQSKEVVVRKKVARTGQPAPRSSWCEGGRHVGAPPRRLRRSRRFLVFRGFALRYRESRRRRESQPRRHVKLFTVKPAAFGKHHSARSPQNYEPALQLFSVVKREERGGRGRRRTRLGTHSVDIRHMGHSAEAQHS